MKTTKLILSGIIAVFFFSCKDYLDPYPNGDLSRENISEYQAMVQGLVGQCYDNMSRNYDNNEGAYFDCASDNAVLTNTTGAIRQMAVGALTTGQDPFLTYWDRDYKSINLVNMFLEDRMGYNTKFLIVPRLDSIVRNRLQGEAFALRAYFQWDLLQKFGGKGNDGQCLVSLSLLNPLIIHRRLIWPEILTMNVLNRYLLTVIRHTNICLLLTVTSLFRM